MKKNLKIIRSCIKKLRITKTWIRPVKTLYREGREGCTCKVKSKTVGGLTTISWRDKNCKWKWH